LTGNFGIYYLARCNPSSVLFATLTDCAGQDSGLPTEIAFPAWEFQMVGVNIVTHSFIKLT